jgi:outer membrane receptor for ferrienterochelin and colicins
MSYLKFILLSILSVLVYSFGISQTGDIQGTIKVDNLVQAFATITISTNPIKGTQSDDNGNFQLKNIPFGEYDLTVSYLGYEDKQQTIIINENNISVKVSFNLNETSYTLNDIVVTGTKTFKRKTNSAVIVNVLSSKVLDDVQACNLSEGLKFQPGLRVETDCQTCNYTQLRMNGLAGGYSQILINGRPIFSALTGLYGLEQLPTNMIERIEVIRGGGSSLYGSSAIGGTVNVLTKIPKKSSYEVNSFYQNINGGADDLVFSGNASLVNKNKQSGITFFINRRDRSLYDHNEDNFSELPELENTSFGTNLFILPNDNQKIEVSISNLNEYRYGGEMVDKPAYLTQQSEERNTNVWMASADYQINFNDEKSSFISYAAWQNTKRSHYTGILPDEPLALQAHLEQPPYGNSNTTTLQGGFQLNHRFNHFLKGINTFTLGTEYVVDDVLMK